MYSDLLCCIVRRPKQIPPSILPFVIFDVHLWLALFIIAVMSFWVWALFRWANLQMIEATTQAFALNLPTHLANRGFYVQMRQIFLDIFLVWWSVPMHRLTRSNNERLLIGSISIVSLIFVSMFQSFLSMVYTRPIYYRNITSLEELDRSGLPIYSNFRGFLDDAFPKNISKTYDNLYKKLRITSQGFKEVKPLIDSNKASHISRRSLYNLFWKYDNLDLVPECPKRYNLAYITPKNSVYLERFNQQLLYMLNGGLINKFTTELYFNVTIHNTIILKKVNFPSNFKIFTMKEMEMPFLVLITGALISLVVFLGERRWSRRKTFR